MKTQIKLERSLTPKDNKTPNFYFLVLISITANHNNRRLRSAQPTVQTEPKKSLMDSPCYKLLWLTIVIAIVFLVIDSLVDRSIY